MDERTKPVSVPVDTPETKADNNRPRDFSGVGEALKASSFPIAGYIGYRVMDTDARGKIIEIEKKSSAFLSGKFKEYEDERAYLSNAVDKGTMGSAEALIKREANHANWRKLLYANLKEKGFDTFAKKFRHLTRVDKQKIIIEGITVGSIILGAVFGIASSHFFDKPHKDDGQSR
jgi:hypothetical protein